MKALLALGVAVAAVVLAEEVLPRLVRVLRLRRLERIRAEVDAPAERAEEKKKETNPPPPAPRPRAKRAPSHVSPEADRLWEEARGIPHQAIPDFVSDWQYMSLLHKAAKIGHARACSELGDYACLRGEFVEAFYWKWKAEANGGGRCARPSLDEIRSECLASGALMEPVEPADGLGVEEIDFARAVIAVQCGLDAGLALRRLRELADGGLPEARLFLRR